jgi:flagellar motor component MotA
MIMMRNISKNGYILYVKRINNLRQVAVFFNGIIKTSIIFFNFIKKNPFKKNNKEKVMKSLTKEQKKEVEKQIVRVLTEWERQLREDGYPAYDFGKRFTANEQRKMRLITDGLFVFRTGMMEESDEVIMDITDMDTNEIIFKLTLKEMKEYLEEKEKKVKEILASRKTVVFSFKSEE